MSEQDFCRWLHGYCEISGERPNDEQWEIIKKHLELVYEKAALVRRPFPVTANAHIGIPAAEGILQDKIC